MLIYLMELTFLIPEAEGKGKYKIYFSNQIIFIKISSSIINNCEIFHNYIL